MSKKKRNVRRGRRGTGERARKREARWRGGKVSSERMLVNPKPVINAFGHRDIVDLLIGWIKDKYISW